MSENPLPYPSKTLKSSQDISINAQVRRQIFSERQKSKSRDEHIQTWRKVTKKLVVAKKVVDDRKKMKRMWKDSYAGMCNRAIVLDEVREIFFIAFIFVEAMANAKSSAMPLNMFLTSFQQ